MGRFSVDEAESTGAISSRPALKSARTSSAVESTAMLRVCLTTSVLASRPGTVAMHYGMKLSVIST